MKRTLSIITCLTKPTLLTLLFGAVLIGCVYITISKSISHYGLNINSTPFVVARADTPTPRIITPEPDYLHHAWESTGRKWLDNYGGVHWNEGAQHYELDPTWAQSDNAGPKAYFIEYPMRGANNMAEQLHDLKLMDELCDFYLVYQKRFTTLGAMRALHAEGDDISLLANQGPDSARTLFWKEKTGNTSRVRESTLGNSQFFHSPALLLRIIAKLPSQELTPHMRQFAEVYGPVIVRDHLQRLVFTADWDYWGDRQLPKHLIDIWKTLANHPPRAKYSYQHMMFDRDLWLIATAAEILGANAHNPELVPLTIQERTQLIETVQVGARLFQSKRTVYSDTVDFEGKRAPSACYFNGDLDDHESSQFANYYGSSIPTPADKQPPKNGSWDISHTYRIPVFMKSLFDNRAATGVDFPSEQDVQMVVNQYMYKVFEGDFNKPLFRNYFDGNDGWVETLYPPSTQCDCGTTTLHCLTPGAVMGWGLLCNFNPDLRRLQLSLSDLAASRETDEVNFRNRYYLYDGETFSYYDRHGKVQYPFLLFTILSQLPAPPT